MRPKSPALAPGTKCLFVANADWIVRGKSIAAIGTFGPAAASALPALEKAADDEDSIVRREARAAIVKIRKK